MQYYLAIDIGASSGRHILGWLENGKLQMEEIHRFPNGNITKDGSLCWDYESLNASIVEGLRKAGELGKAPAYIAIDTWGVDYVLLDKDDKPLGKTYAYRDSRTEGVDAHIAAIIPNEELYAHTGTQKQPFNTIYQLWASKNWFDQAESMLMVPDYLNWLLTGVKKWEYTFASTTGLLNAAAKDWDWEIIDKLGYPRKLFGPLTTPGTVVGPLSEAVAAQVGYQATVVQSPSHDTASAVMAVPAEGDDAIWISSGTWSLMGVEIMEPITTPASCALNLTNEGGYDYRYRYLKNIMGLWIVQNIRKELGPDKYGFAELSKAANEAEDFTTLIDCQDQSLMAPQSMIEAIKALCVKTNQPVPETVGQLMRCAYTSLAKCYADTIREIADITGKQFSALHIVGGGSQDNYLNALTAKTCGITVYTGPTEATAIGNLLCQAIAAGDLADLSAARQVVRDSFELGKFEG